MGNKSLCEGMRSGQPKRRLWLIKLSVVAHFNDRFPPLATASRFRITFCYRMHLRTGRSQEIAKPL
jgi:hypothetical protein